MDLVLPEQGDLGWVFPSPLPPNLGTVSQKAEAANDSVEKAFSQGLAGTKTSSRHAAHRLCSSPCAQPAVLPGERTVKTGTGKRRGGQRQLEPA